MEQVKAKLGYALDRYEAAAYLLTGAMHLTPVHGGTYTVHGVRAPYDALHSRRSVGRVRCVASSRRIWNHP